MTVVLSDCLWFIYNDVISQFPGCALVFFSMGAPGSGKGANRWFGGSSFALL
jgi:hypothetical protein